MSWLRISLLSILMWAAPATAQQNNNLVYHMLVRSFADTPADEDKIGDLKGIRENLGYLNDGNPDTDHDLEAGILWLMPIFPSPSYHGYDVADYYAVSPEYGTMEDLKDLVAAAHQRGLRIILDIPFNHTSDKHPWFKQALDDPSSRFRRFYHFSPADQPPPSGAWHLATGAGGAKIRYLGLFDRGMPDLDFNEPEVRKEVKAIAKFWLDRGVDGFRLDASKHIFGDTFDALPEPAILRNNDWWREFSDFVAGVKPDAVLVGEVLGELETLRRHAYGNDSLLDEPFMNAARSHIAFPRAGFLARWRDFINSCREVNRLAHMGPGSTPRSEPFHTFVFIASHDKDPRLASHLEEMKRMGMRATVDQAYRLGMYLLTAIGKYPVLYSGDELMQRGFKWNGNPPGGNKPGDGSGLFDETLREPLPWHKAAASAPQTGWLQPRFDAPNDGVSVEEEQEPGSMLHLVRGLTNLRTGHPGYANGELGAILTDSEEWMVFEKVNGQDRYLVLISTSPAGRDYEFHQGWSPRFIGAQLIFWSDGVRKEWRNETKANRRIQSKVFVPPYGLVLLRQQ
jgi:glycosidase